MPKLIILNNAQINSLKWDGKNPSAPTQYPVNSSIKLYIFCYTSGKKIFYYRTKDRKMIKIGEYPQITLQKANLAASEYYDKENSGEIVAKQEQKIQGISLNEIYNACYDEAYPLPDDKNSEEFDRATRC